MVTHTSTSTYAHEKKTNRAKIMTHSFFPAFNWTFLSAQLDIKHWKIQNRKKKYYSHEIVCFLCELNLCVFVCRFLKSLPIASTFILQCKWWFWYAHTHSLIQLLIKSQTLHSFCVRLWYMTLINNHSW